MPRFPKPARRPGHDAPVRPWASRPSLSAAAPCPRRRNGIRLALCAVVLVSAGPALAQAPEVTLGEPVAAWPEPFSLLAGLRELPDGRLLVSDGIEEFVAILDLESAEMRRIGRRGEGPGEYRTPDALFPLAGDSTLLVDLGNGRLTPIAPDGSFGDPTPIARPPDPASGGMLFLLPRGTDSQGRLYLQPFGGGPDREPPDSAALVRFDRVSGAVDTVAWAKLPGMTRSVSGPGSSRSVLVRPKPFSPQDSWGVAPDGRVAVARAPAYRLEWIEPDGRRVRGREVPVTPLRVGRREKEVWLARQEGGLAVMVSNENGRLRTSFSRGAARGERPRAEEYEWPERMAPFEGNAVRVAPWGEAWVERSAPAGAPGRHDVFGPDGSLRRSVVLPPGRRVAGFGLETVYLVRRDELDFEWLEKYARPRS